MCDLFGGPSAQEEGAQAQSAALSASLFGNYTQEFAQQQNVLTDLNSEIGKVQSGTQGPGFSGAENAANIAQIENTSAGAAKNADQATMDATAGQGGGGASGVRSGVNQEVKGQINTGAANEASAGLQQNTLQSAAVGRQNAAQTIGGLTSLSGQLNPAKFAEGSLSATNQNFNESDTIQQQQAAKAGAIASLVEKGVSAAATGGMSLAAGGGFGGMMNSIMGTPGSGPGGSNGNSPNSGSSGWADEDAAADNSMFSADEPSPMGF